MAFHLGKSGVIPERKQQRAVYQYFIENMQPVYDSARRQGYEVWEKY
jgi:hypothetical protein